MTKYLNYFWLGLMGALIWFMLFWLFYAFDMTEAQAVKMEGRA